MKQASFAPRRGWSALGVALLVGCSGNPSSGERTGQPAAQSRPVPVTVATAQTTNVPVQLQGIGTVHAYSTVSVKSKIAGEVAKVGFREGDEVKVGDLIFLIDPRPYAGALEQAKANLVRDRALLVKAKADFRRTEELLKGAVVSQSDFDAARANRDAMQATVAADETAVGNAQVQLDYCYIRSPINGRVGTLLVNQGNIVKDLDTVLVVIAQLRPIYVDFAVPEQSLPEIRKFMAAGRLPVVVNLPQHAGPGVTGELEMIDNEVDTTTGTIRLRAQFANEDEFLWPGQFVEARLTLTTQKNVVVVPSDAVQDGQQGQYLCVVKPDLTVEFRPVVLGASLGDRTVVTQGVRGNERVITSGQLRLVPGTKVEIKSPAVGPDEKPGAS